MSRTTHTFTMCTALAIAVELLYMRGQSVLYLFALFGFETVTKIWQNYFYSLCQMWYVFSHSVLIVIKSNLFINTCHICIYNFDRFFNSGPVYCLYHKLPVKLFVNISEIVSLKRSHSLFRTVSVFFGYWHLFCTPEFFAWGFLFNFSS